MPDFQNCRQTMAVHHRNGKPSAMRWLPECVTERLAIAISRNRFEQGLNAADQRSD